MLITLCQAVKSKPKNSRNVLFLIRGVRHQVLEGKEEKVRKRGSEVGAVDKLHACCEYWCVDLLTPRAVDFHVLLVHFVAESNWHDRVTFAEEPRTPPEVVHVVFLLHRFEPECSQDEPAMYESVEHTGSLHDFPGTIGRTSIVLACLEAVQDEVQGVIVAMPN